jgi:cytosine deaminase
LLRRLNADRIAQVRMTAFIPWPDQADILIRNARVPGCLLDGGGAELAACDIRIADGAIAEIAPNLPAAGGADIDVGHGIVLPGLADLHTHIDKGHIWPRAWNPDGTHLAAVTTVKADREANWTTHDVAARMEFSLRCAYAHGTVAIRTHLDSAGDQLDISWPVFRQKRAEWAGRIALQAVALVPLDLYATPFADRMADVVAASGGIMGGTGAVQPDARACVRRVFDLAIDRNLDVDMHVDETGDPAAHLLRVVAEETIRRNWHGRVTCGHCCSLSVQDPAIAAETIALVAAAGITVVSLPMVNLYLQGRNAGTPTWRGVTLLHELRAAGVRVVLASDNTRDPFYAFGDLDLVEVLREAVRIGHLDAPVGAWPAAIAALPGDVMGADAGRLRPGAPADLVLFPARSWSEFFARPQSDRLVVRHGRAIDATPPSYRELDRLFADQG